MSENDSREGRVALRCRPALVLSAALAALGAVGVVALACGSGGDASVAIEAGSPRCPSAAPTSSAAWNPPDDAGSGPCDAVALALLGSALGADPPPTYLELERRLREGDAASNAACAACVFSSSASVAWGPFVSVDDAGTGFVNFGACYARAPGGSDACGRAVHQQTSCLDAVCSLDGGACRTETLRLCAQQALQQTEGCGRFDVAGACGQSIAPLTAACQTPLAVVTRLCGATTTADAGVGAEAGAP